MYNGRSYISGPIENWASVIIASLVGSSFRFVELKLYKLVASDHAPLVLSTHWTI